MPIEAALNCFGRGKRALSGAPARLFDHEGASGNSSEEYGANAFTAGNYGLYEKKLILQALMSCGGKIVEAAALLQIPRTTLQYKIRKYGLMIE